MTKKTETNGQDAVKKVFGNATRITAKSVKKEKEEIEFKAPFDVLVSVAIVEAALKGVKENLTKQFKKVVFEIFVTKIKEELKQPESFKAICGDASASFQFKKSNYGFGESTANLLTEKEIPFDTEEKSTEQYIINPAILANQALLEKLAVAINTIKGFEDIEVIQVVEGSKKYQFTDATLAGVATKCTEEEQIKIFDEVSTLALADCKLAGENHKDQTTVDTALQNLVSKGVLQWNSDKKAK